MNQSQVIIEENQRFSQSRLWDAQREFYDEQGVNAWAGDVPFYITSNPFIAHSYAEMVIRFIQDWTNQHPDAKQHPFYILELGTGSGKFSFYTLKKIMELHHQLKLSDISIRYIMSDFTENNIKFWETHQALTPYLEQGVLDFAVYDSDNDTTIPLHNSGTVLAPNSVENPMIVFANYLFDSVQNDVFSVENGELRESLVRLKTPKSNLKNDNPIDWKKVDIEFEEKQISGSYYGDEKIDSLLFKYQHALKDTHFLFPIGSLNCLKNLQAISNNKLLLISSDKGYSTLEELDDLEHPVLDFHGSFSLMVNYHAIGHYFSSNGGDCFLQTPRDGLSSGVFASGFTFETLPETNRLLKQSIEGFSPSDYYYFYEHFDKTQEQAKLNHLISFLCFSGWDPAVFDLLNFRILDLIDDADEELVDYFLKNLPKIVDNFYYVPECEDTFFAAGLLMYEFDHYEKALAYYRQSEKYFGKEFEITFNTGLCYFYLDKYPEAVDHLTQALAFNPKAKEAKELLSQAKHKLEVATEVEHAC